MDCSASYLYTIRALKTFEVIDHVALADWGQVAGFAVMINRDIWNDLDDNQRRALQQAGSTLSTTLPGCRWLRWTRWWRVSPAAP